MRFFLKKLSLVHDRTHNFEFLLYPVPDTQKYLENYVLCVKPAYNCPGLWHFVLWLTQQFLYKSHEYACIFLTTVGALMKVLKIMTISAILQTLLFLQI